MTEACVPPAATNDDRDDDVRPTPEAERRMRELRASLPPPPTPEELARQQGKPWPLPTRDDPMRESEAFDWGDTWDGFNEWLAASRRGEDISRWLRDPQPDDER